MNLQYFFIRNSKKGRIKMKLEFKVVSLQKDTKTYKNLKSCYDRIPNPRHEFRNEFIIIGENEECYKALQLHEEGLSLIGNLGLEDTAYLMPKEHFEWDGCLYTEIDIPKKHLCVEVIENIQRLN